MHLEEPIYCTDCHRSRARYLYPHQPNLAQTRPQFAADVAQNCRRCHEPIEKHNPGHLLARDNPNLPTCTDCHGSGHNITPAEPLAADLTVTCRNCHQTFDDPKIEAVHLEVVDNLEAGQTCQTCHTDPTTAPFRVNSPSLCASCHADEELMAKYDISPNVFETYVADFHGTTLQLFELDPDTPPRQAVCFDCHGIHNIRPPNGPEAGIGMKDKLLEVCRQCHEEATLNFPDAWLAHSEPSPQEAWSVYYTENFFKLLTSVVMIGLIGHIGLDFVRLIIKKLKS